MPYFSLDCVADRPGSYLHYIRRKNPVKEGPTAGETRAIIVKAYDFALEKCGMDRESGEIWQEYLEFLASPKVRPAPSLYLSDADLNRHRTNGKSSKSKMLYERYTRKQSAYHSTTSSSFGRHTMRLKTVSISRRYVTLITRQLVSIVEVADEIG